MITLYLINWDPVYYWPEKHTLSGSFLKRLLPLDFLQFIIIFTMACWAGVKSKKHDSRFGQFSNFLSIGKAVRPPNSQYFSLLLPDKEEEMQKYQEQLKFLFGQTIHWILLMSLERIKGSFSMTWAALVDIYLYPEKSNRAPFWFFHWKSNQNLIWFSLSFSLLILNVVMYQNIFHFSGKLPEKVNFDIWVSLKVRCRDYEETCQARQLSAATWSQREFSPRRRRRCTWFCSWFFLALCCTLFLSEQTWRHPTPLVATCVALWCSNCQHLCTGQYQARHLSMN